MPRKYEANNNLREKREALGYSLDEASGLVGMTSMGLSYVERGLRRPSPRAKVRIARGLGLRVKELFPMK
jgi:transcriptional regulator with XRE-family HTH domain